ncbi:MAG: A24 family peptidase [Sphingobium sp.]
MTPLVAAPLGAVLGAIAGSFLATLILRWPEGRSVARGRSQCDGCGRMLGLTDLVPLLSALAQRGQCRACGARIDPLHCRVELGCAVLGGFALGMAPDVGGLAWALLGWLLLALAILDWRHFWLPDALTLPLAFAGLTIGEWATDVSLMDRAIGATTGYGALLLIGLCYRAVRGRDGLGMGDAKLLGALGAWFGWQTLPFIMLIAATGGLVAVLGALAWGKPMTPTTRAPFGTLLAGAALPAWLLM